MSIIARDPKFRFAALRVRWDETVFLLFPWKIATTFFKTKSLAMTLPIFDRKIIHFPVLISASHSSSVTMLAPSSFALFNLLPAFSPATTISVFLETEDCICAPNDKA